MIGQWVGSMLTFWGLGMRDSKFEKFFFSLRLVGSVDEKIMIDCLYIPDLEKLLVSRITPTFV